MTALEALALVLMAGALLLVPVGLPGLWVMVAILVGLSAAGEFPWLLCLALAGVAGLAELAEFLVVKRFGARYGGSSRAFWGAILGGMVGLFAGLPIPVVGPVLTALLGTFAGAALVTAVETRSARRASRVGWGVLLARVVAAGGKVGAGVAMLAVTSVRTLLS